MPERVAGETEIFRDERIAALGGAGNHRLAKIKVGIEIPLQASDLDIGEFGRNVRDRVVPANLSVGDHFEAGFELVGDGEARHLVLGVEEVRRITFATIERGDGATKSLDFGSVADARIATGACKMQTGKLRIGSQTHANDLLKGIAMKLDETDGSVKAGVGVDLAKTAQC